MPVKPIQEDLSPEEIDRRAQAMVQKEPGKAQ